MAVSVGVLLLAFAFGFVLAPTVVRRSAGVVRRALRERDVEGKLKAVDELVDVPFPAHAVIRTLQLLVFGGTALILLVVWGYAWLSSTAVSVLVAAIPTFVRLLVTVGLLLGAVAGTRYLEQRLDSWLADANYVTAHQEGVVFRILQLCLFIAAGLAALSLWNVDLGGLLVGAGFLGIVIGLAARQTLGSLIAGFVLMFSQPFEIGDWVHIDGHDGIVVDITVINTRLRSFDGETVVLPNDRVSSHTVINRTKRNRLRLRQEVGVDYETDLERAESIALEAIEAVEHVAPAPKPEVVPTAFGDSAVTLECRFWIKPPNVRAKWQAKRAVIHAIKTAYDREGIVIPYPQRQLSRRSAGGPARGRDESDGDRTDEALAFSEDG
ncbi:mechanosensitive ion channel family protein [Haloterrigena alkaliphila]|uniref:mechanosensitive ion channel family protein n=1 Tax=Haloterrigena alkaliphila TaxID=2816475 RepID=UPI001CFF6FFD|nr:mechanosensitive ion channel family protein [Haloterrigena alkaliphila]UHQ95399.1 mechanosensitive ion channel family protein [Haloterrigena alkaliphila]